MSATFAVRNDTDGIVWTAIQCEHGRKDGPNGTIPADAQAPLALSMLRGLNQRYDCTCKIEWIEEQWDDARHAKAYFADKPSAPLMAEFMAEMDEAKCPDCTVGLFLKAAPRRGADPDGEMYLYHEPDCPVGKASGLRSAWRKDVIDGSTRVV